MDFPFCTSKDLQSWVKKLILARSTFWITFLDVLSSETASKFIFEASTHSQVCFQDEQAVRRIASQTIFGLIHRRQDTLPFHFNITLYCVLSSGCIMSLAKLTEIFTNKQLLGDCYQLLVDCSHHHSITSVV